jgi:CRP-like cAMP-binding protein
MLICNIRAYLYSVVFVSCVMMSLATEEAAPFEFPEVCEPFVVPLAKGLGQPGTVSGIERELERGAYLYRAGSRKTALYRLEAGILCVTASRPVGPPEVVEMLFPGSFLGLGFLEHNIDSAMAVVPCRITEFDLCSAATLCAGSSEASDRQATLTEREFAARRRELVSVTHDRPVRRVAAFLSALVHMNRQEGRNPTVIAEFLKTGDVAAFLDLKVEALAAALADLNNRGLVTPADNGGLILLDIEALDRLAA